ncbi:MAG: ABC transporter ATP-binding protein [Acidimicrobiaceae bacterium]|nr:ABC transporter ATP-binding protein [Acidimicrobiaceae bacterium]MYD05349.1 ABC transporter ATP-binding protein [Acidimicrobiaceae bacterium]MYI57818.1 ABC transporter ATP-binding protein [Acidimicrobiaceae bacterium]
MIWPTTLGKQRGPNTVLTVSGVNKTFSGIIALDDVSLTVESGERVGLIGPNGAGKTTLFNCLSGILRPDAGRVELNGVDVTGHRVHKRAQAGMGRTFQRIELFSDTTVREHLLIAERVRNGSGAFWKDLLERGRPTDAEVSACDAVLELLGLADVAEVPIESLSLGQGRLVEVGRALMTDPQILLLDEPSSGLDREETNALAATLGAIQNERGFAILLVEHDVELVAEFTTRLYVLDFGQLIAHGPTTETLASPEVRNAYLGSAGAADGAADPRGAGGAFAADSAADSDGGER